MLSGLPQQVWAENHRYQHTTNGNWAKYRGPLNVASVADYLAVSQAERQLSAARQELEAGVAATLVARNRLYRAFGLGGDGGSSSPASVTPSPSSTGAATAVWASRSTRPRPPPP